MPCSSCDVGSSVMDLEGGAIEVSRVLKARGNWREARDTPSHAWVRSSAYIGLGRPF